jgi:phytoene dehydrogenase-like protein
MPRQKVIIIGAGITGLSAGCHLRASGYDTEIYEAHSLPGGLCTSWKRGDFLFDGCIHWLPGISRASLFYDVNDEVLDLQGIQFVRHDTIMSVETLNSADPDGNHLFHLYGNIDRFEQYLRYVAPEDNAVTDQIIRICRLLSSCRIPPMLDPPELLSPFGKLSMIRYLPLVLKLSRLGRYTMQGFAARARSPFLKEALQRLTLGKDYPAFVQLMQIAFAHQGSSGTPLGGSLSIARRIERLYLALGGKLVYKSRVKRIVIHNGRAKGVELYNGTIIKADIVISNADGHWTLFEALEGKHMTPFLTDLYALKKLQPFESLIYVSLGLRSSFTGQLVNRFFSFAEPRILCDGSKHTYLHAHLVNFDPAQAPAGKSVINVMMLTSEHAFWKNLRGTDRAGYAHAKENALHFVLDVLEEKIGGVTSALETWDVATPATFERYTGNWKGSYEGWYPDKNFLAAKPLPRTLPGVGDFFMAGQWTEAGGGITPCIKAGRDVARIICHQDKRAWVPPNSAQKHSFIDH